MNFNILRVQFTHSMRTFGIRCLPSFQNKPVLITTHHFIKANTRSITRLSNNNAHKILFRRQYNTSERSRKSIVGRGKTEERSSLTIGQKVVGAAKVSANISIIVLGIGVFGVIIYFVLKELFSPSGSTKVFNEALEKIRSNPECQKILGTPIKGHGGSSSSGRRRHRLVRFQEVINTDGTQHKLMRIYLEGSLIRGTALLDMTKNNKGIWVTKYLVVSIPEYNKRIFIEYNDDINKENKDDEKNDKENRI
ncbi:TIM21-domain-containing protein [Rhizophagus irregularis]|nr:TIM21-domain-containing protein [Rhizophagus irregularis]PKK80299.1 TIM21-domain-containing protein [Rhizophagus irregularis]